MQSLIRWSTCLAMVLGGLLLAGTMACAQSESADRYEIVDGFAVHGFANGREIGYQWYRTRDEAEESKARMEKTEVLTRDGGKAKYYDLVEIKPERRRIERPSAARKTTVPHYSPAPPAVPRPGNGSIPAAPAGIVGTWVGSESASDTTSLRFEFKEPNRVVAYDDTGVTWSGTWKMVGSTSIVIVLTQPHQVNYSGQVVGNRITGKAGRPTTRQWTWSVTKQPK